MIVGIGHDLVEIARVERALARHPRLIDRILTPMERPQVGAPAGPEAARLLAKRFAAKEAVAKALGLGLRAPMGLQAMSVGHSPSGQPCVIAHGDLKHYLESRSIRLHLSLSDERLYASATAVAESLSPLLSSYS